MSKLQVMQATDQRTEMSRLLADAQNQMAQYRQTPRPSRRNASRTSRNGTPIPRLNW